MCPHCGKGIPNDSVSCPVCNRTIRIEKHDPPQASAPATPPPDVPMKIPSRLSAPRKTTPPVDLPDEISDLFSEWQRQKAEKNFLGVVDTGLPLLFSPELPSQIAGMVRKTIAEAYVFRHDSEFHEKSKVAARRDLISAEIERSPNRADLYWLRGLNEGEYGIAVNMLGWHWWEPIYSDVEAALDLDDGIAHYWWVRGHFVSRSSQSPPSVEEAVLWKMALSDFDRAIDLEPTIPLFYTDRANVYYLENLNFPQADADYTKAIELEHDGVALAHFLAERGQLRLMRSLLRRGDSLASLEGAAADFGRAAELNPDVPLYHYKRARCCWSVSLESAVKEHDDPGFFARKQTYFNLAMDASTKAIDLQPTSDHFHLRGELKKHKGNYHGAIDDFTHAIALDPTVHKDLSGCSRYMERGKCFVEVNDYENAIGDLTRALDNLRELAAQERNEVVPIGKTIDMEIVNCYETRATYYVKVGRLSDAISDLTSALGTKHIQSSIPRRRYLHSKRKDLYEQTGNLDAAGQDMKAEWSLNPLDINYSTLRFFQERKDYASIAQLYSYTIDANPDDPKMYENRAVAYIQWGDAWLALLDLNKAIELDPSKAIYYSLRGAMHKHLGHEKEAEKDRMKYEELKD